ncbi:hypothetical protein HP393_18950 [Clostridioides difficile]|nr:hypothetical protein [Clostridioides difficile]
MQLEGMEVSHMKFGEGKVMELEEKYITILFPQGEKKFLYPNSFNKFLTLKDKKVQTEMNNAEAYLRGRRKQTCGGDQ